MSDTSIFSKEKLLYIINKYNNIYLYIYIVIYIVIGLFVYFKLVSQSIDIDKDKDKKKDDEWCHIHNNISLFKSKDFFNLGRISNSEMNFCFICIISNISNANSNNPIKQLMLITKLIQYEFIYFSIWTKIKKVEYNKLESINKSEISIYDNKTNNEDIKKIFNYNFFENFLKSSNSYIDNNRNLYTILSDEKEYIIICNNLEKLKKEVDFTIEKFSTFEEYKNLLNKTIEQIILILSLEIFYYKDFNKYKMLVLEIGVMIIKLFNINFFNLELDGLFNEKELTQNFLSNFYKDKIEEDEIEEDEIEEDEIEEDEIEGKIEKDEEEKKEDKREHKCIFSVTNENKCLLCCIVINPAIILNNNFTLWKESIEKFEIIKNNYNCNDNYANYKIINLNFKSYFKNEHVWVSTNMKNIYIHIYYFFYYYYNDFIKFIDDNSYENYNKIIKYFIVLYETLIDVWFVQTRAFYLDLKASFFEDFVKDRTLFFENRGFYLKKKLILKVSKIIKAYLWSINIDIITSVFNKIAEKIAIFNKEDKMKTFLKYFILLLFSKECVYYDKKYIEFKKSTINLMAAIIKDDVKRIKTKSGGKKTNKEKYKILVNM